MTRRRRRRARPHSTAPRSVGTLEKLEPRLLLAGDVLYRVNAGGPAISDSVPWEIDTNQSPSPYVNLVAGDLKTAGTFNAIDMTDASLPAGTPMAMLQKERWDKPSGEIMKWSFPVSPGEYEVRLYFAETWTGGQGPGNRVFDVQIEGATVLDNFDVYAEAGGGYRGIMRSFTVTADAALDIHFPREVQNPAVKGIEVLTTGQSAPATLAASANSLDFGTVLTGESSNQVVTLTNSGQAGDPSITIDPGQTTVTPNGGPFTFNYGTSQPIVLAPGQSTPVTVTYSPTAEATTNGQLDVIHDGANSPLTISLTGTGATNIPISFQKSSLGSVTVDRPTSLQFGPDGRLYVAQQNGLIRVLDVVRNAANDYDVVAQEQITLIQSMVNRNDNGVINSSVTNRLVTGILVTGTAANPVIYVGSSDPRIGGGNDGDDLNLDTNSSIISRLTYNGSTWEKLDLVRGLPRSEENHHVNGMQLDPVTNTLYVMAGGNTNMGARSNNFALLPEFALSAAILSIDLDAIGNTTYDLPTLDDEDWLGADPHDPFGGNNGKNQAILVPGGPVQVYAPGFRNAYDLVITTSGQMFTVDNGPNAGWGDVPINEGPQGNATNGVNEPGVTYGDGLHHVTGPGYYGGHPNPTRSNPNNTFNASNPQSPVSVANPIESDYQIPGVENDAMIVYGASTNGIDEYTPGAFGGAMQGDLIIASFDNTIKRVKLDANGDLVFSENLFSNVGFRPLDVTVPDAGPFLNSIWAADIGTDKIYVFEPDSGVGGDPNDLDGDCYTNADEQANGTNPNSAADVPPDNDQDCTSDLLDDDDDNDTILDVNDPFAIDANNGAATPVGTLYSWENGDPNPGGLLSLGFTGLMTNGGDDYLTLFDPTKVTAGGAAGVFTVDSATVGTALNAANTQEQAFQFGVNTSTQAAPFSAVTSLVGPFNGLTPQAGQTMGLFIGTGDQDNYLQIALSGDNGGEIQVLSEQSGTATPGATQSLAVPGPSSVDLILTVDPQALTVQPKIAVDGGAEVEIGTPVAIPAAWLSSSLAVGLISTDPSGGGAMPVTWDFLGTRVEQSQVTGTALVTIDPGGNIDGSSTFKAGSFRILNTSSTDRIASVTIDISTSVLPDVVYDPDGIAGDPVGKAFTPDTGATDTGLGTHAFLGPHDDGYDALAINFDDFDPGEEFTFSVDIDPTSIRGASQPGPADSGSVSGMEMSGATVTVTFEGGGTLVATTAGLPGSLTGSDAVVEASAPAPPGLSLLGVAAPAVVTNGAQTLRVTGAPGSTVRVLHAEAGLYLSGVPGGGFDIDPFETNKFISVNQQTVAIGGSGFVDLPVTLLNSGTQEGYNHFFATTVAAGTHSDLSNTVLVKYEPDGGGGGPTGGDFFFSTTAPASATGTDSVSVSFDDSDIVQMTVETNGDYSYALYFDGSDVGLKTRNEDINALAILSDGSILVSTVGSYSVPGVSGGPEDILRFIPSSLGANTAGTWELYFDGSDVGLSAADNLSGVSVLNDGSLALAFQSSLSVPGLNMPPQDLARFTPTQLGANTAGSWSLLFDGSANGLTTNGEKIDAVSTVNGVTYELSTQNGFNTGGVSGDDEDVFRLGGGPTELVLDASAQGITAADINAWHAAPAPAGAQGEAEPAAPAGGSVAPLSESRSENAPSIWESPAEWWRTPPAEIDLLVPAVERELAAVPRRQRFLYEPDDPLGDGAEDGDDERL